MPPLGTAAMLSRCKFCGRPVAPAAPSCPGCGGLDPAGGIAAARRPQSRRALLLALALAATVAILVAPTWPMARVAVTGR
jgi:hypothetical protein